MLAVETEGFSYRDLRRMGKSARKAVNKTAPCGAKCLIPYEVFVDLVHGVRPSTDNKRRERHQRWAEEHSREDE